MHKTKCQVVAPGYDVRFKGSTPMARAEVRVDHFNWRAQAVEDKSYPPVSAEPEVNYIFGVYASRSGTGSQAKSFLGLTAKRTPPKM